MIMHIQKNKIGVYIRSSSRWHIIIAVIKGVCMYITDKYLLIITKII